MQGPSNSLRTLNLVVVDDDPFIVRLLTQTIERHFGEGMRVFAFLDSALARKWIDEQNCDLLISDIEMPEVDGMEMLRFAKKRNPWTQVIFLTGHSTWDRIEWAIENGATDYLLKPVDHKELIELLDQQVARIVRWQCAVINTLRGEHERSPATPTPAGVA